MTEFYFKSNGKFIVKVENGNVTITRKGIQNFLNQGSKGEKSIPIKSLTAIQLKEPRLTTGFLQFAYSGSNESKGGVVSAVKDENTILFTKKELDQAKELKAMIERLQNESEVPNISQMSAADELKKFKELLDEGIINDEEFLAKKKQLLGI